MNLLFTLTNKAAGRLIGKVEMIQLEDDPRLIQRYLFLKIETTQFNLIRLQLRNVL